MRVKMTMKMKMTMKIDVNILMRMSTTMRRTFNAILLFMKNCLVKRLCLPNFLFCKKNCMYLDLRNIITVMYFLLLVEYLFAICFQCLSHITFTGCVIINYYVVL